MKIEEVAKLTPMERLLYWIQERESIRLKRKAGQPPPWTNDEILQRYRFCNVRRMDDKVSQWFLNHWYKPNYGHKNMLVACCLARQFNNPEAMEAIGFPKSWNPARIEKILKERASGGLTNFGAAYMITGYYGGSKVSQVVWKFIHPLCESGLKMKTSSMREAWSQLVGKPGFRSFIAGQVIADLRWATSGVWNDRTTWVPMGPGSLRGLHRFHDRWIGTKISEKQFLGELNEIINHCRKKLPQSIHGRMEAMDFQNCMCEFEKYTRTLIGAGHPKQKYRGAV
jgi:hypothetical protein